MRRPGGPETKVDSGERKAWTRPAAEEVAAGVYRIPLPMPGDHLKAVNVYALEEAGGLTLIDGGWAQPAARAALEAGLWAIGARPSVIKRILVTHAHRDHYTLAVILRREFGTLIALGAGERDSIAALTSGTSANYGSQVLLLRAAGAGELARFAERQATLVDPERDGWEAPDQWLDAGVLPAGGSELTLVPTPGHTRGHLIFADLPAACCSPAITCCRTSRRPSASTPCPRPRRWPVSSSRSPSCGPCRTCGCCRPTDR